MPSEFQVSPETIGRMAEELIALPLTETQQQSAATLVSALNAEMTAMRALPIGSTEPVTLYDARES